MKLKIQDTVGHKARERWRLYNADTGETLGYYRTRTEANDEKHEYELRAKQLAQFEKEIQMKTLDKERYKIGVMSDGNWAGVCPTCGEVFRNTDISASMKTLISYIKSHEEEKHKE